MIYNLDKQPSSPIFLINRKYHDQKITCSLICFTFSLGGSPPPGTSSKSKRACPDMVKKINLNLAKLAQKKPNFYGKRNAIKNVLFKVD